MTVVFFSMSGVQLASCFGSLQCDTMERGRLPAASKGKAKMPEEEKKTKGQKVLEAAANAVHAADLEVRGRGIEIRESMPSATQIPVPPPVRRSGRRRNVPTGMDSTGTPGSTQSLSSSRKRTHADVEPIQKKAPVTAAPLLPQVLVYLFRVQILYIGHVHFLQLITLLCACATSSTKFKLYDHNIRSI